MNIIFAMLPAFCWGTTYAVTQYTLAEWPPLLLGALRSLPAGLILLAIKPTLPERKDWKVLTVLGTLNIAMFFGLIFVMALTLPSAISGVGMISVPVFAMLFSWLFHQRKPSQSQVLCGSALILLAWLLFNPSSMNLNPVGLIAMLSAIMCIVIGSTVTKTLGSRIHWWTVLTWQLILGGVVLSLATCLSAFLQPQPYLDAVSHISLRNLVGLLWVILLNTVFAYSVYVWLLQRMSVVDFTFGGVANPLAGIVAGYVLLDENFTLLQYGFMFGMIIMSLLPQVLLLIKQRRNH
ncbi:EamA family transporter [Vibrio azureus]|uniref:EamA domain-containing protein n=1 Tax=Vibrio azureus NBRC 104587 TaxID=1219077 RepID=U3AS43_9VIBR|nr:EamA family transporter [Vibrio azureus]AUI87980.1 EamA family transporter [Vibrio azureus]GAD76077.1 hypothetical protein VAZ01S_036_00210 [Vibrio azureus NBRC 104587]